MSKLRNNNATFSHQLLHPTTFSLLIKIFYLFVCKMLSTFDSARIFTTTTKANIYKHFGLWWDPLTASPLSILYIYVHAKWWGWKNCQNVSVAHEEGKDCQSVSVGDHDNTWSLYNSRQLKIVLHIPLQIKHFSFLDDPIKSTRFLKWIQHYLYFFIYFILLYSLLINSQNKTT